MSKKFAWILSGLLVAGIGVFIVLAIAFPPTSPPTAATLQPGRLDLHSIGISPARIIGAEPSGPGNAADDYRRAMGLYQDNAALLAEAGSRLDALARGQRALDPRAVKALKAIDAQVATGATRKEMRYVLVHTPKTFRYSYLYEPADDLETLCGALTLLAYHYRSRENFDAAETVLQHQFVLGWHMVNERGRMDLVTRGLNVQQIAIDGLEVIYRKRQPPAKDRLAAIAEYRDRIESVRNSYLDKLMIFRGNANKLEPGDVFNIIANDADRACRVQALLELGRLKFLATERGDIKKTDRLIRKYAGSDDPLEAAAAKAAGQLTLEEYRMSAIR